MNDARRFGCGSALAHRPGPHFNGPSRKKGVEAEQIVGGVDQLVKPRFFETEFRQKGAFFLRVKNRDLLLELPAQPNAGVALPGGEIG